MKTQTQSQRSIIEQKLKPWLKLRGKNAPPSGWVRAIRGALGMSTYQLAKRVNVDQSVLVRLEGREQQKKITLELLDKVAGAINCKLVYALVPKDQYNSLEDILDEKATLAAEQIVQTAEHSMLLEAQGRKPEQLRKRVREIAKELKTSMGSKIWDTK